MTNTATPAIVTLCYKKVISAESTSTWDKSVFHDTYMEFYLQAQQFDQHHRYGTFREILQANPRADQMHYLVSTAAVHHLRQLDRHMPDLATTVRQERITFDNFRFEILDSHVRFRSQHAVAIYFYSDPLLLVLSLSNGLLLGRTEQAGALLRGDSIETDVLKITDAVSITSYRQATTHLSPTLHFN